MSLGVWGGVLTSPPRRVSECVKTEKGSGAGPAESNGIGVFTWKGNSSVGGAGMSREGKGRKDPRRGSLPEKREKP